MSDDRPLGRIYFDRNEILMTWDLRFYAQDDRWKETANTLNSMMTADPPGTLLPPEQAALQAAANVLGWSWELLQAPPVMPPGTVH